MNIYVGNLNYNTTENELEDLFSEFGNVSKVTVIKDQYTGQGKGFGFVEMENSSDSQAAIEELDGAELKGRNIKVNEAKPRERR